jgi:chromosome segregation ATPase
VSEAETKQRLQQNEKQFQDAHERLEKLENENAKRAARLKEKQDEDTELRDREKGNVQRTQELRAYLDKIHEQVRHVGCVCFGSLHFLFDQFVVAIGSWSCEPTFNCTCSLFMLVCFFFFLFSLLQLRDARMDRREAERNEKNAEMVATLKNMFPGVYGRVIDLCKPSTRKYNIAVTIAIGE